MASGGPLHPDEGVAAPPSIPRADAAEPRGRGAAPRHDAEEERSRPKDDRKSAEAGGPEGDHGIYEADTPEGRKRLIAAADRRKQEHSDRLILVSGAARHGKTQLAQGWDAAERGTFVTISPAKSRENNVALWWVDLPDPNATLVDLVGDNLQKLAGIHERGVRDTLLHEKRYNPGVEEFLRENLWPFLKRVDGLILTVCFPMLWLPYNEDLMELPDDWNDANKRAMVRVLSDIEDANRTLVLLLTCARSPKWAKSPTPPPYGSLGEEAKGAGPLDLPVFVALTKADLYTLDGKLGLRARVPGHSLNNGHVFVERVGNPPGRPHRLLQRYMPDLSATLQHHVRRYTVQYISVFDGTGTPSPIEVGAQPRTVDGDDDAPERAVPARGSPEEIFGTGALTEFFCLHPWALPLPESPRLFRMAELLYRDRDVPPQTGEWLPLAAARSGGRAADGSGGGR